MHTIGPNDVVEVVNEEHTTETLVNGLTNGDAVEQAQQIEALPPLFDMDLERMHIELYKGKYLTPQEFLDDVGKIVHNAGIRMQEDPERLYKAQAMFTAAQVSIHEFDPQLRMECERMATRERKRREEHRKSKGKGKAHNDATQNGNNPYPMGTRRSARHNGQQPELSITDPLKLERRLKRQRSDEAAIESHGSDEEHGEGRERKRSKTLNDDELNFLGTPQSQSRPLAVRFAPPVERMETVEEVLLPRDPNAEYLTMAMDVDPSPRKSGFDPTLLNPVSPNDDPFVAAPSMNGINGILHQSVPYPVPSDLFISQIPLEPTLETNSPPRTPSRLPASVEPETVEPSMPVVIERSPTPPHADFHVDELLVSDLKDSLRAKTGSLTIEQLEQLRATCLGCIWRHRKEWDRDGLVRELQDVVKDFLDEVAEDDDTSFD